MKKLKQTAIYLLLLFLCVGFSACNSKEDDEPTLPSNFEQTLMSYEWASETYEDVTEWDGNISLYTSTDYNFFFEDGYGIRLEYWQDKDSYFGTSRGYEPTEFRWRINGGILYIDDLKYTYSNGKLVSSNGGCTLTKKLISEAHQEEIEKARLSFMDVSERLEKIAYSHEFEYVGSYHQNSKDEVYHKIYGYFEYDIYTAKQMGFQNEIYVKHGILSKYGTFEKSYYDRFTYNGYLYPNLYVKTDAFNEFRTPASSSITYAQEYYLVDELTGNEELLFSDEITLTPSEFKWVK